MTTTGAGKLPLEIFTWALTFVAAWVVMRQCRKPAWLPGRLILWSMNAGHANVTRWGLEPLALPADAKVLDVGCGGGRTVRTLAERVPAGKAFGLDYSAASVDVARATNRDGVASGHVDIRQGSVSDLPYPDASFDAVTAVETHYYWPSPVADLRGVLRVLKPGGRVLLIAETYKGRPIDFLYRPIMMLLGATYLTVDEHRQLLEAAGFADVLVETEPRKGWIRVLGTRPAASTEATL